MDFLRIHPRSVKKGLTEISPKFVAKSSKDLMIRGGDFYAIWDERKGLWSTKQDDVVDIIDLELEKFYNNYKTDDVVHVCYMWDADSGSIDRWHKYVQKQVSDNYHPLDETLVFANSPVRKEDYASKRLPYALESGDISAWDELVGTLYSPDERHKIEWAIGSIVSGDSKENQKFVVFYGEGGTGKSTILRIIKWLFDGYFATFDAKSLGSGSDAFALEPFKNNPLVAIEDDGDLSKIEDNTRLNSLVAHEEMIVNEKFAKKYTSKFKAMLFMGTNKPVKITDARSGIIRRLIDISPTGKLLPKKRYDQLMKQIKFELGAIAYHCLQVYEADKYVYDDYIPKAMIGASNAFYNFVSAYFDEFFDQDGTTLAYAWDKYNEYCTEAKIPYTYQKHVFKEELKAYFWKFDERATINGERVWNYYSGFRIEKFGYKPKKESDDTSEDVDNWLKLEDASTFEQNILDIQFADCPAQYATNDKNEKPIQKWDEVKTTLKDIDTSRVHYVMSPANYICIDFDKTNEKGEKSLVKNLDAAKSWPPTYAEVSKGGQGLHLEYIYTGDPDTLARVFEDQVEIKISSGKSSLRRRLSKCNNLPIATISSGLPLKGEKKVLDSEVIKNEKILRKFILNCLNKDHHGATAPEIDFIYSELEKCYESGMKYDISDLKPSVIAFANDSTNQAQKCLRTVSKMHFKSDEPSASVEYSEEAPLVFFDIEVFPNMFLVCYKIAGEKVIPLMNSTSEQCRELLKYRLIGFNNRKYDNHMLYARIQGYTIPQLYNLSQLIIEHKQGFIGEAYGLSYTDIYDFASNVNKMGLKKWEVKLGISHQELGLPWNQSVPEDKWDSVVEYCINDVEATEVVFNYSDVQGDFVARLILADIAEMTPNDTTNQLTTKIIFGNDKNPQKKFVYTDLSTIFPGYRYDPFGIPKEEYTGKIVNGKSIYRGNDPSEGGRVYAEPGIYYNVALLDIASMHPSSIENLNLFGPYTKRFSDLKQARLYIKHKEYDKAKNLFDGKLAKYLDDPKQAKALSTALKTAINSVYGLTSAGFDNKFRDPRNVDNIVAKRGALFMIELQLTLQEMGVKVAHVKTDSIKIPEANQEIIDFVMEFGKKYGYTFEHEATYEKLCLVNESVYIAKDASDGHWTATGTQFQIPYVFKSLFSHEPINFEDMCEMKSVTSALYLDFNEGLPENEHCYTFVGKVGLFCPMLPGSGGGELLREKDGKYNSATGAKGYRWMEAEMVRNLHLEDKIDRSYYDRMVDEAIETIEEFGDFEMFIEDESRIPF